MEYTYTVFYFGDAQSTGSSVPGVASKHVNLVRGTLFFPSVDAWMYHTTAPNYAKKKGSILPESLPESVEVFVVSDANLSIFINSDSSKGYENLGRVKDTTYSVYIPKKYIPAPPHINAIEDTYIYA